MSRIVYDQNDIELKVIVPIIKIKQVLVETETGPMIIDKEIFQKEIIQRKVFKIEGIKSYGEYITTKNTIAKQRCTIFDSYTGKEYLVRHNYKEIKEIVSPSKRPMCGYNR